MFHHPLSLSQAYLGRLTYEKKTLAKEITWRNHFLTKSEKINKVSTNSFDVDRSSPHSLRWTSYRASWHQFLQWNRRRSWFQLLWYPSKEFPPCSSMRLNDLRLSPPMYIGGLRLSPPICIGGLKPKSSDHKYPINYRIKCQVVDFFIFT